METYVIVVAHLGAVLGLLATGFNLYAMVIDRRRDQPRLVVSARVRNLVTSGLAESDREGTHLIVNAVNAGPGPITVMSCLVDMDLLPRGERRSLFIAEAAPERPPLELGHGRSITFMYRLDTELLPSMPTKVMVFDSLGREWGPSKKNFREFLYNVGSYVETNDVTF